MHRILSVEPNPNMISLAASVTPIRPLRTYAMGISSWAWIWVELRGGDPIRVTTRPLDPVSLLNSASIRVGKRGYAFLWEIPAHDRLTRMRLGSWSVVM